jgi:hypothetical protein
MTRENLYVALTRGREANMAYVAVDKPDDSHEEVHPGDNIEATARSVLFGVLQHVGAELSAHETITAEQEVWGSIAQLRVATSRVIVSSGRPVAPSSSKARSRVPVEASACSSIVELWPRLLPLTRASRQPGDHLQDVRLPEARSLG